MGKVIDFEKYRLKLSLQADGVEWHEDQSGKFKIWLKVGSSTQTSK